MSVAEQLKAKIEEIVGNKLPKELDPAMFYLPTNIMRGLNRKYKSGFGCHIAILLAQWLAGDNPIEVPTAEEKDLAKMSKMGLLSSYDHETGLVTFNEKAMLNFLNKEFANN